MKSSRRAAATRRHGSLFVSGTGGSLQSDNLTPRLKSQGVTAAAPLTEVYDVSGTFGGPIAADRLWYFVNGHVGGSRRDSSNVYYNLNAGDPSKWLYAPDSSRREYSDRTFEDGERAADVADDAAPEDQRLWDPSVAVPHVHGRDARSLRAAARLARGRGCARAAALR